MAERGFDGSWSRSGVEHDASGRVVEDVVAALVNGHGLRGGGDRLQRAPAADAVRDLADPRHPRAADGDHPSRRQYGDHRIRWPGHHVHGRQGARHQGVAQRLGRAGRGRGRAGRQGQARAPRRRARHEGGAREGLVGHDGRPSKVEWTLARDALGRVETSTDPDRGAWIQKWNGFGELTRRTAPSGRYATFAHDGLGRVTARREHGSGAALSWGRPGPGTGQTGWAGSTRRRSR